MREIVFRGKRIDTGEWEESAYPFGTMSGGVVGHDFYPTTIGQYTGLVDKNGKKIFEGDLLRVGSSSIPLLVEFTNFSWECTRKDRWGLFCHRLEEESGKYEVVGNIHDTPDLLEVQGE